MSLVKQLNSLVDQYGYPHVLGMLCELNKQLEDILCWRDCNSHIEGLMQSTMSWEVWDSCDPAEAKKHLLRHGVPEYKE